MRTLPSQFPAATTRCDVLLRSMQSSGISGKANSEALAQLGEGYLRSRTVPVVTSMFQSAIRWLASKLRANLFYRRVGMRYRESGVVSQRRIAELFSFAKQSREIHLPFTVCALVMTHPHMLRPFADECSNSMETTRQASRTLTTWENP